MTDTNRRKPAMFTPHASIDPIERATGYPYEIPETSFLFENGHWRPVDGVRGLTEGRIPVIGCGSNRSPVQLARKYADFDAVTIPVQRAWLEEFDTVFAAHITGYGSVAANLTPVPGARVEVSITWLSEDQLPRMHATEGRGHDYDFARLDGVTVETEHGERHLSLYTYVYRHGSLRHDGAPVGLREIASEGRPHASMGQREILGTVHGRVGGPKKLEDFIHENIQSAEVRFHREELLQADAIPFEWEKLTVIED
jgi:hypothetical protein